jgi:hypothetical protein
MNGIYNKIAADLGQIMKSAHRSLVNHGNKASNIITNALLSVFIAFLVQACAIPFPKLNLHLDKGVTNSEVEEIRAGKTTKSQVLEVLGKPMVQENETNSFFYQGANYDSVIGLDMCFFPGDKIIQCDRLSGSEYEPFFVQIAFDEKGVVLYTSTSTNSGDLTHLRTLAENGNDKAAYLLGVELAKKKQVESWQWLCKAASKHYAEAYMQLGHMLRPDYPDQKSHEEYVLDEPADYQKAYMLYQLADIWGAPDAKQWKTIAASRLSKDEITKAVKMAKE